MEKHRHHYNIVHIELPKRYVMNTLRMSMAAAIMAVGNGASLADQVILDDLIVEGSACVGIDCTNGENFGFDTIRLKENNLRIKFQDTSSSGSFPSNDWQITINDSANGGANKFSIDDVDGGKTPFTIEAGAPSNSLYVDDDGKVGMGTSTPAVDIHTKSGDSPTLRLEQDGSSGWTPQIWDVAGNETNFFVRDVTNGSRLPFKIRPSAPTNSLYIDSDGDIGLGTASPAQNLHVQGGSNDDTVIRISQTGSSASDWEIRNNIDTGRLTFTDDTSNSRVPVKFGLNSVNNLLRVGTVGTDRVDIGGSLYIAGSQVTPDYVFDPNFTLASIEAHGASMWENKHLPAVAPASTDEEGKTVFEIGARSQGMLEELEIAHIYIFQLNETISELREESRARQMRIAELESRLVDLEAHLGK